MTIPRPHAQAEAARPDPFGKGLSRVLRFALVYGVLGPPIAALWLGLAAAPHLPSLSRIVAPIIFGMLIKFVASSYLSGLGVALLSGALIGLLPKRCSLFWSVLGAGLIGWLVTIATWLAKVFPMEPGLPPLTGLAITAPYASIGGVSALTVSVIIHALLGAGGHAGAARQPGGPLHQRPLGNA